MVSRQYSTSFLFYFHGFICFDINSLSLIAVSGALVGSYVWWRRPQNRLNAEEYIQYKAMLISLATHLLLLMFELLAADNLQSQRHLWILVNNNNSTTIERFKRREMKKISLFFCWQVFVPLVFISIISIAVSIWSVRHDRSFELELFCAVNILQFIFLALKLDR